MTARRWRARWRSGRAGRDVAPQVAERQRGAVEVDQPALALDLQVVGAERLGGRGRGRGAAGVLEQQRVEERGAPRGLEADGVGQAQADEAGALGVAHRLAAGDVEGMRKGRDELGKADVHISGIGRGRPKLQCLQLLQAILGLGGALVVARGGLAGALAAGLELLRGGLLLVGQALRGRRPGAPGARPPRGARRRARSAARRPAWSRGRARRWPRAPGGGRWPRCSGARGRARARRGGGPRRGRRATPRAATTTTTMTITMAVTSQDVPAREAARTRW